MWTDLAAETVAGVQALSTRQYGELWSGLTEQDRRGRTGKALAQARFRSHLDEMCHGVFPDRFEYGWNVFHRSLLSRAAGKMPWRLRAHAVHRAIAAPRGFAKSTLVSFADVAHDVVYGFERFIGIVSTTAELSETLAKDLHQLFTTPEAYPEFHALYGPFAVKGGETAFVVRCPSGDPAGTRIMPTSVNGTVRGQKHAGVRFTRWIIDDYEHPKHVLSAIQRQFAYDFLMKDVGRAGRRGTVTDVVGTVLHPDSVLARLLKAPAWRSEKYQAIVTDPATGSPQWPRATAMWERARLMWANLEDDDRETTARTFYERNQVEMDKGAVVLWPEGRPLWDLMVSLWSDPAAFWSEDMNEPRDPSQSVFDPEAFVRCVWTPREGRLVPMRLVEGVWAVGKPIPLSSLDVAIWHDRSKGGAKNDFPATAVVARDPSGYRYVLALDLTREPASGQRARVWRMWEALRAARSVKVGCDDTAQTEVFGGESFERERKERQKAEKPWNLNLRSYTLDMEKNARISSQEPDAKNGWLQFATDLPPALWDMYRDHPKAAFDDGPDAIERADWLLTSGTPHVDSYGRG